tara:strand:- start:236 stop:484 length:249 start_codon:yes stop_codon:yes gene_type:complete
MKMKFNHLLTEKDGLQLCKNKNLMICKWKPVSEGQATAANNIGIPMLCEACGARTHKFMKIDEYRVYEKLISREVNNDKTSK